METLNSRIKQARKAAKLSQKELGAQIGLSQGGVSWLEQDGHAVTPRSLRQIAETCNVTLEWLQSGLGPMQDTTTERSEIRALVDRILANEPESFRSTLIESVARMSDQHAEALRSFVIELADKFRDKEEPTESKVMPATPKIVRLVRVPTYLEGVGAGPGQYVEDATLEVTELTKEPPPGTDFMLRVAGDSMQPRYQPGDLVFVHGTPDVAQGQIGIFSINGEMFIKKYTPEGLESLNPDYETIRPTTDILAQGLVLGVCDDSYFE